MGKVSVYNNIVNEIIFVTPEVWLSYVWATETPESTVIKFCIPGGIHNIIRQPDLVKISREILAWRWAEFFCLSIDLLCRHYNTLVAARECVIIITRALHAQR